MHLHILYYYFRILKSKCKKNTHQSKKKCVGTVFKIKLTKGFEFFINGQYLFFYEKYYVFETKFKKTNVILPI